MNRTELLWLAPALIFLFILPFPHTVALRLTCLFVAAVIAGMRWRRLDAPPFPLKAPIILWAAVVVASLAFAVDLPYSVREVKNELGYTLLAFGVFYVLVRDEAILRWLCLPVSLGFVVIALSALADYAWNGRSGAWWFGTWGFYGGMGAVSGFFITAAPVVALAIYLWRPPFAAAWGAGAAVLGLGAGMISGQRAIWPGIGAQLTVLCFWLWLGRRTTWRPRQVLGAAVLVLAVLGGGLWTSERLRTLDDPLARASMFKDLRPRVWMAISHQLLEHPLQGAGFGQRAMVKAYPHFVPPENPMLWHAHNLVLNYGVYAGVPGVVAILFLFIALFVKFWRISRSSDQTVRFVGLAGAAIVAGVFARNTFNDFFIRDGALLFWALAGALLGYALRRSASAPQSRETKKAS